MANAKSNDWKTRALPASVKELVFEREFSRVEMEQIQSGLVPKEMEDKWFIYYDNDSLNFHRSWTGHQIYKLTFTHLDTTSKVTHILVNRDASEYNEQDDIYDINLLNFLIDRLLLNKNVPFPTRESIEKDKQAIFRNSVIGYGRPNKEE